MKKFLYIIIVVVIAGVGFYLGRLSGFKLEFVNPPTTNTFHPMPPPPPESQPYFIEGDDFSGDTELPIILESPADDTVIQGAFQVSGRVRSDNKKLQISLLEENGDELFSRRLDIENQENDESYIRFSVTVGDLGYSGEAVLKVVYFESGGGEEVRNLNFLAPDLVNINLYFTNLDLNPWGLCEKVFPVKRQVSINSNIYKSAIEALLAGPTESESLVGYESELPEKTKVKSVGADAKGVVTVDFDYGLERGVAGSCQVTAIRTQIESLLKQFPEVREVVITVEGEREGILQP